MSDGKGMNNDREGGEKEMEREGAREIGERERA